MNSIRSRPHIFLTVKDLLLPERQVYSSLLNLPLPQRGVLGKTAQRRVQDNNPLHFEREYAVKCSFLYKNYRFTISGKIDGVLFRDKWIEVEEIKSVIMKPAEFRSLKPDSLATYTQQLFYYCYILKDSYPDSLIKPVLNLINLTNDRLRRLPLSYHHAEMQVVLFKRLDRIIEQNQRTQDRILKRKNILSGFRYPLSEKRPQQDEIIEAVRKVLEDQTNILISAPTGTGKTAAVLFPALKQILSQGGRIFYTTAKNTQQRIVAETLQPFKNLNLELTAVFLRAARKLCLNDYFLCHDRFCPFINNFDQRLHNSDLEDLLRTDEVISTEKLIHLAQKSSLCPHELLWHLSRSADCVVGDFNYVLEPLSLVREYLLNDQKKNWVLIIDEAHQLYSRSLEHLTARIRRADLLRLLRLMKSRRKKMFRELADSLRPLMVLFDQLNQEGRHAHDGQMFFEITHDPELFIHAFEIFESIYIRFQIDRIRDAYDTSDDPIETFYYQFRHFIQILRHADGSYRFYYTALHSGTATIQCCDPSGYLQTLFGQFKSVIAMSATLTPLTFYQSVFGIESTLSLSSPYPACNRKVVIIPTFSTRLAQRQYNYPHYAGMIKNIISLKKGNYLVFFPSFEFLQHVNLFLGESAYFKYFQRPQMTEAERNSMIEDFSKTQQPQILLAVLGGIFSESIDLVGKRCIGVIIFSPALPPISVEREMIRDYYDQQSLNGYEYTYIIPGMTKVIQSAGRLIRAASDKGIVVIVGERFKEDQYMRLLPEDWFRGTQDVVITHEYRSVIASFWQSG